MRIWTPASLVCRICQTRFPMHHEERFARHISECVERNADAIAARRPQKIEFGDPELAAFARAEGDVHNRRPGTRKPPR